MLHELTFLRILESYRDDVPLQEDEKMFEFEISATVIAVAVSGGQQQLQQTQKTMQVNPRRLIALLHAGSIINFSVQMRDFSGEIIRGCVSVCSDKTIRHEKCSETSIDIAHCLELLRNRCGK